MLGDDDLVAVVLENLSQRIADVTIVLGEKDLAWGPIPAGPDRRRARFHAPEVRFTRIPVGLRRPLLDVRTHRTSPYDMPPGDCRNGVAIEPSGQASPPWPESSSGIKLRGRFGGGED